MIYQVKSPPYKIGNRYYFTTNSALDYEVIFGRKQTDCLHVSISFGIINNKFEDDEYALINNGDVYRVMNTIQHIVSLYLIAHPTVNCFEFTVETKKSVIPSKENQRIGLFRRYAERLFDEHWTFFEERERMLIQKKKLISN